MVTFYKHDIPAWMDGTEGLTDGAYRVYHVVCQLIYLNEGPISLNERGIAGRCCQRLDRFKAHLNTLLEAGKLVLAGGQLSNGRATAELKNIQTNRQNAGKGGSQRKIDAPSATAQEVVADSSPGAHSAVTGSSPSGQDAVIDSSTDSRQPVSDDNPLKTHNQGLAPLADEVSLKEKRREEESREEESREEKKESLAAQADAQPTKTKRTRKPGVYAGDWDFEAFWAVYPRKDDKGDARNAMLAVERSGVVTFEVMMAGIANIDTSVEKRFVKHAGVWLRKESWANEPSTPRLAPGAPVPFQMKAKAKPRVMIDVATFDAKTWKTHIDRFLYNQTWDEEQLGPDPESRHCHIPKAVLDANGIRRPPITVNLNNGQKPQAWPTTPTPAVPDIEEFTQ